MPTEEADTEEYEYRHFEWRAFQEEEVRTQLKQLLLDGWELGSGLISSGPQSD